MVKGRKKLDFWFWVKAAVIGFMVLFLFYPFCTLITRSFFPAKQMGSQWKTISDFSQRNIIIRHWEEAFLYLL